jgi:hypothetical protein
MKQTWTGNGFADECYIPEIPFYNMEQDNAMTKKI